MNVQHVQCIEDRIDCRKWQMLQPVTIELQDFQTVTAFHHHIGNFLDAVDTRQSDFTKPFFFDMRISI